MFRGPSWVCVLRTPEAQPRPALVHVACLDPAPGSAGFSSWTGREEGVGGALSQELPSALPLRLAWPAMLPVDMDCQLVFVGTGESETLTPGSKASGLRRSFLCLVSIPF